MPKTRNAYALRGFDEKRILQRPFFRDLHFSADKMDEEIFKDFCLEPFEPFADSRAKLDILETVFVYAIQYGKRIQRHGERLLKYMQAVEYRVTTNPNVDISTLRDHHNRAGQFLFKYCGITRDFNNGLTKYAVKGILADIGNLGRQISFYCKELDEKIKIHYRKIFAERLKSVRKELKMTQTEFAWRLGLSQRGISNFENAVHEPNLAMLANFSQKLKRPIDWFLGLTP